MIVSATNPEAAEKHVRRWHADCICRGTLSCQVNNGQTAADNKKGRAA